MVKFRSIYIINTFASIASINNKENYDINPHVVTVIVLHPSKYLNNKFPATIGIDK